MPALELAANFSDPDRFYAALTDLHRDVSESDSERINARLILLLANHIGDQRVLDEALSIAGTLPGTAGVPPSPQPAPCS